MLSLYCNIKHLFETWKYLYKSGSSDDKCIDSQHFGTMRLPHRLQGQKVKSQSDGAGAYCGGHLAAQLVCLEVASVVQLAMNDMIVEFDHCYNNTFMYHCVQVLSTSQVSHCCCSQLAMHSCYVVLMVFTLTAMTGVFLQPSAGQLCSQIQILFF